MKTVALFGQRKSEHNLIELMVAWDEYCVDAYQEGFEEECEKAKESWGDDLAQWRIVEIEIDEKAIHERFADGKMVGKI